MKPLSFSLEFPVEEGKLKIPETKRQFSPTKHNDKYDTASVWKTQIFCAGNNN